MTGNKKKIHKRYTVVEKLIVIKYKNYYSKYSD